MVKRGEVGSIQHVHLGTKCNEDFHRLMITILWTKNKKRNMCMNICRVMIDSACAFTQSQE